MPFLGLSTAYDQLVAKQEIDARLDTLEFNMNTRRDALSDSVHTELKTISDRFDTKLDTIEESIATNANSLDEITEFSSKCTTILRGIHSCREPIYEVKHLNNTSLKDMIHPEKNYCIAFDKLEHVFPHESPIIKEKARGRTGHLDLPDNYVCVEKSDVEQYVDAIVPHTFQNFFDEEYKSNIWETGRFGRLGCSRQCRTQTCEEIANPSAANAKRQDPRKQCGACSGYEYKCKPFDYTPE